MSLARGIQSAIFFYLSCAPCTGYAHQRRRRKEAQRDRAEKRALEMDQPDAYRHPDPSSTNPHWNEEIALGPGPPPRGKKKARRNIGTAGTQNSTGSRANSELEEHGVAGIRFGSPAASDSTLNDDSWNRQLYQREDESLWGLDTLSSRGGPVRQPSSDHGSAVGLVALDRPSTGRSISESYYTPRAPPINDLHPPVVSTLSTQKVDNSWMLQPPPSAKVMSGKERASKRSRSGSGTSSRVDVSLQRGMSQRTIEGKIRRGETPELPPRSRGSSYSAAIGQRHDRESRSVGRESPRLTSASSPTASAKKRSLERASVPEDSDVSEDGLLHDKRHDSGLPPVSIDRSAAQPARPKPTRQKLPTVHSGESIHLRPHVPVRAVTQDSFKSFAQHKENINVPNELQRSLSARIVSKPAPLVIRDSSLNLLQELVSPSALLNSHFVKSPTLEARIKLPPTNSSEELQLRSLSPWFPSDDFMAMAEETDSDVSKDPRMRWSMDI